MLIFSYIVILIRIIWAIWIIRGAIRIIGVGYREWDNNRSPEKWSKSPKRGPKWPEEWAPKPRPKSSKLFCIHRQIFPINNQHCIGRKNDNKRRPSLIHTCSRSFLKDFMDDSFGYSCLLPELASAFIRRQNR